MRLFSIYAIWIGFTLLVISSRAMCHNIDSLKQVISTTTDISVLSKSHLSAATYYGTFNDEVNVMHHARILFDFYKSGKVNTVDYDVLVTLILYHLRHENTDTGLYLIPIAIKMLKDQEASQNEIIQTLLTKADLISLQENYTQSLVLLDSIRILLLDVDSSDYLLARLNWSVGDIYNSQGEVEKSLTYYLRALKYHEEQNSPMVAGLIYNIAMIYFYLGEFDKAEEMFLKSMHINKKKDLDQWLASSYNALGEVYQEKLQYSLAYNYFKLSEHLFDSLKSPTDVSMIYASLGNLFLKMAQDTQEYVFTINEVSVNHVNFLDSAGFHYKAALKLAEKYHYNYVIRLAYRGMGLVFIKSKQYQSAIHFLTLWEAMSEEIGDQIAMSEARKELAKTHFKEAIRLMKSGKIKQANKHLLTSIEKRAEFQALNDSIFSNEKIREFSEIERKYELDKKDRETAIQAERIEAIERGRRKNLRVIIYTTSGGLLLVIVFLFALYKRFKVTKELNQTIGEQKTDLETSHNELKKTSESINSSIMYASRIQKSILTTDGYLSNMFREHYVFYKPKDIVSGDYYWAFESKSGNKIWAVVDCTGHGIPGGFMSMIGNTLLNEIVVERGIEDPGKILNELRLGVIKTLDQNQDSDSNRDGMTIGLCVFNPISLTVSYAGSETPLYIVRNTQLIEHDGQLETIALAKTMTDFQTNLVQLEPGDWIYLSTDGFPDARGGSKGKKYMYGRFREQLILLSKLSDDQQLKQLEKEYDEWVGDYRQMDDICIMGIRV